MRATGFRLPTSRAELDEYTLCAARLYKEYKVPMPKGLEERMKDPNLHTNGVDDPRFLAFSGRRCRALVGRAEAPREIPASHRHRGHLRTARAWTFLDLRCGIDCGTHTQGTEREASGAVTRQHEEGYLRRREARALHRTAMRRARPLHVPQHSRGRRVGDAALQPGIALP
ncbi:MAG: hypothetical protein IPP94_17840 [Ignavibacteria bacterium]|nr:hypothetical protein [Ignavibacteria bacterium]